MDVSGFTKVNTSVQPEYLKPDELSYLSDGILSKVGSHFNIRKRGAWRNEGFALAGSTITGLEQLLDEVGTAFWVAHIGTTLQKYSSGAWSNIKTGLTTGLDFKFVRYNDYNIITNGTDELSIIGGAAFANVRSLEIARPVVDTAPDVVSTQNAATDFGYLTPNKQYRYVIVYASDDGDMSAPSKPIVHYITGGGRNSTSSVRRALYLHNLPESSDARVTKKLIYRTEGDGETYYLRKVLENDEEYFEDWGADDADSLDYGDSITYLNVPLFGKHIVVHRDRLFIGNLKYNDLNVYEPVHSKKKSSGTTITVPGTGGLTRTYEDGQEFSITGTSVGSGTGSLEPGASVYKYRIEFVDIFDRRSTYVETSYTTDDTTSYDYYVLDYIPEAIVGAANRFNPLSYKKRLWRTLADGNTFYLLEDFRDDITDVGGGSTVGIRRTYQDSTTDATLATREQWVDIGTTQQETNVVGLAFSDVGKPTVIPLENYREIFADEGGEITGIYDDQNGILIFKDRAIFKLYTEGSPVNWRLVKVVPDIGCSDSKTLTQHGGIYYFRFGADFYAYASGGRPELISRDFEGVLKPSGVDNYTPLKSIANNKWYMVLAQDNITSLRQVLAFDRMVGTWYLFSKSGGNTITIQRHGTDDIYTNSTTRVVKYNPELTLDSETGSEVAITPYAKTGTRRISDGIEKGRLRKLFANLLLTGDVTISILDPDAGTQDNYTFTAATSQWKTDRKDISNSANVTKPRKVIFVITGSGLTEFNSLRLELRPIREGYGS